MYSKATRKEQTNVNVLEAIMTSNLWISSTCVLWNGASGKGRDTEIARKQPREGNDFENCFCYTWLGSLLEFLFYVIPAVV